MGPKQSEVCRVHFTITKYHARGDAAEDSLPESHNFKAEEYKGITRSIIDLSSSRTSQTGSEKYRRRDYTHLR